MDCNGKGFMKRVLIVDDSPTSLEYLRYLIDQDEVLEVAGIAHNGVEAIEQVFKLHPDVVLMDIQMPRMNGYDATRRIMAENPVPIVMVTTSLDPDQVNKSFRSMEAGALSVLKKPEGPGHPESEQMTKKLIMTARAMSEVKVVRRRSASLRVGSCSHRDIPFKKIMIARKLEVVAMGASTGGPQVFKTILSRVRRDFHLPILIVQHITDGFLEGLVKWLRNDVALPIQIPAHQDPIIGGHIYFAPDRHHMGVDREGRIVLKDTDPEYRVRPAVSFLFRSIAESFGDKAVGILLSGMGKDGALELKTMKERGALTIAQDKESSVVQGMSGEAIRIGAATYVMSPSKIAEFLNRLVPKAQTKTISRDG